MAKKKTFSINSSLAQALGETVHAAQNYSGDLNIEVVPLRRIELDPDNPRDLALTFNDIAHGFSQDDSQYNRKNQEKESLETLANSIKEQGVLNPIIVYKYGDKYRLITGERRTLASIIAGKDEIQARVLDGKPTALKLSLLQWIENIEREDLSLWERIRNLEKIIGAYSTEKDMKATDIAAIDLAQLIGCGKQLSYHYKNVLLASPKLRKLIEENKIRNLEKAALIAIAPLKTQTILIKACLNSASLKDLKTLASKKETLEKKTSKKGRKATKINFGSTINLNVAKSIFDVILQNEQYGKLRTQFAKVEWENYASVSHAFKDLIKALEKIER